MDFTYMCVSLLGSASTFVSETQPKNISNFQNNDEMLNE